MAISNAAAPVKTRLIGMKHMRCSAMRTAHKLQFRFVQLEPAQSNCTPIAMLTYDSHELKRVLLSLIRHTLETHLCRSNIVPFMCEIRCI